MTTQVQVIGAGGHARVVISTLGEAGYDVVAAWDDDPATWGTRCLGVEIRGGLAELRARPAMPAIVAIGDNRTRARVVASLDLPWLVAVHPRAWVDRTAQLGPGTVVFAGAIVQPQAVIGAHAIVNTAATVDHDCQIGDFAHLGPGTHLCGNVAIGTGALLGVGACARPGGSVGAWATIGAGGIVVGAIAAGVIAVGVPAKPRVEGR